MLRGEVSFFFGWALGSERVITLGLRPVIVSMWVVTCLVG